jgi:ribose transport system permease protein
LICRMFDLSVGSVYALSTVVTAWTAVHSGSIPLAFLAGLASGAVTGLVNGFAVAVANINPFIATLATSLIVTGIAVWISNGLLITVVDPAFTQLGQGVFLTLTIPSIIFLIIVGIGWFVLARTTYGRHLFAVGGNPEAARLSGVRVQFMQLSVFVISGVAAALAGVLTASRIGTGEADIGTQLPLIVIAVVVVGGTSIFGGEGAMWRTLLGVLLYAMVGNGFALLNVNNNIQQIIQGLILLVAVGIDAWSRKRSK